MALFRSAVQGTAASNIVVENQFVAFARTNKGYFVINNSGSQKTKLIAIYYYALLTFNDSGLYYEYPEPRVSISGLVIY